MNLFDSYGSPGSYRRPWLFTWGNDSSTLLYKQKFQGWSKRIQNRSLVSPKHYTSF